MKPKLVDHSLFEKKLEIEIIKPIVKKNTTNPSNYRKILINCFFLIMIFIGIYLLYDRYKKKNTNEKIYNKKIENLYNTINKYES